MGCKNSLYFYYFKQILAKNINVWGYTVAFVLKNAKKIYAL